MKSGKANGLLEPETLEEAGVKDLEGWSAGTYETEGKVIEDPGTGKTISLRMFDYKINPESVERFKKSTKQDIFNAHAGEISRILWGDGLRPFEESSPRVIIDMKNLSYKIIVPCEARLNTVFPERAKNLEEMLKQGKLESQKKLERSRNKK